MRLAPQKNAEAAYILRKMLLHCGAEVAAPHRWLSEVDRWKELVFALLTQTTKLPQTTVRAVTDYLFDLDLLQVPALTDLLSGKDRMPDPRHPHTLRIMHSLQDAGFSRDESVKSLIVICQAAQSLSNEFSGKIQLYLRSYAERLVEEAVTIFHFSHMNPREVRFAFTLWLQNVLNMPLSLKDPSVQSFCRSNGFSSEELFDAADELDINPALVDDLIYQFQSLSENADVVAKRTTQPALKKLRKKGRRLKV